jgi:hypothetical protein
MGAVISGIVRAFMLIAPGYFANDIIEGVGKVTGVQATDTGGGVRKFPIWFSLLVLGAVAAAVVLIFKPFNKKR